MTDPVEATPFDFGKHRQDAIETYLACRPLYERLAEALRHLILVTVPPSCGIHSIEARAKDIESFAKKASKRLDGEVPAPRYPHPIEDITDLAGIRVITYFPRDVVAVSQIVEREFDVRERLDKSEELVAQERFGYQSIHYIIGLHDSRTALPEYHMFTGRVAEVQIRTILQHAWAEMEHDIQYKAASTIPSRLRRRFMSLAGMLEIADREFQAIQDDDAELRKVVSVPLEQEMSKELVTADGLGATPASSMPVSSDIDGVRASYAPGSARALLAAGFYQDAVTAYTTVIRRYPSVHTNYLGRARAHFLAGDVPKAMADLATAWALHPDDPQIAKLREQIEEGQPPTLDQRSNAAQAEVVLGNARLSKGDGSAAFGHYSSAETLGWQPVYSQFNKAMALCLAGSPDDAMECLKTYQPTVDTPLDINTTALMAIASMASGSPYQELLTELQDELERIPRFEIARSPLRYLQQGIEASTVPWKSGANAVFALLGRDDSFET